MTLRTRTDPAKPLGPSTLVHVWTATLNPSPQVAALVSRLAALLAAPPAKPAAPGPEVTRLDDSNKAVVVGPTRLWRLYDRLTSEDIETIVRAHAAGTIQKDLAAKFNISVSSIQRVLRDYGDGRRCGRPGVDKVRE